ncbi:hypothetical protein D915_009694 [Fasciola hepatica]|uniref:Uncharacterized protein n=1 Tax=Fasciola hepatica TaxID=6192 RepID=A0A4E0QUH5_FASHE|nr:hypothetical protein D915_009694 [Fasciola hepatica]
MSIFYTFVFVRPTNTLLVKVREPSGPMQPQLWRLRGLANSDELVQLDLLLGFPDNSTKIPPLWTSDRNHKQTRTMKLANMTKCHQRYVLVNDVDCPEQYPKNRKKSGKLSGYTDLSEKSEDSDDLNALYGVDDESTVTLVSKSKGKSTKSNRTTPMDQPSGTNNVISKDFHKRSEPARADEEESNDSGFGHEAALKWPEVKDDTLVCAAPDEVTDFELSGSGDDEEEGEEEVDEEDIDMGHGA